MLSQQDRTTCARPPFVMTTTALPKYNVTDVRAGNRWTSFRRTC